MPFVLLFLGFLFLVVAINGTQGDFFSLLKSEFTGANNFVVWIGAIMILGLLGYFRPIRPITHGLIALVFLVLILTQGTGFFDRFNAALKSPVAPSASGGTAPAASMPGSLISSAAASPAPALATPSATGGTAPSSPAGLDLVPDFDSNGGWIGYSRP